MREQTDISASRLGHKGAHDGTVRELKKKFCASVHV